MITIPMRVSTSRVSIPASVAVSAVSLPVTLGAAYQMREGDIYDGPYEFTPYGEAQYAQTTDKVLYQDIKINPIPSNYGLVTYNGAFITVS